MNYILYKQVPLAANTEPAKCDCWTYIETQNKFEETLRQLVSQIAQLNKK